MSLPDSIPLDPDDWHEQLYEEDMDDDAREAIQEFVEDQMIPQANAMLEEAIYKRRQADKQA